MHAGEQPGRPRDLPPSHLISVRLTSSLQVSAVSIAQQAAPPDRTGLAWQNTAYNQPPHPSFFIGDGMAAAPRPMVYTP
ncbi:hypothetical protein AB5J55_35530 [Streptomyces sp. R11]|uniref:Rhamnogalacturonan lyase family 11 C-terminal domain-containing protein n=1 Tax=Streptomyces sp. R11 TaxID=3238625 RepID=A0AB39NFG8_9ACTN